MNEAMIIYISNLSSGMTNSNGTDIKVAYDLMRSDFKFESNFSKWPISSGSIGYRAVKDSNDNLLIRSIGHITEANFHTYEWDRETSSKRFGERLRSWKKAAKEFEVKLLITGNDREKEINKLHDAFEYDIMNLTPGTLLWGDGTYENTYSIEAYVVESKVEPTKDFEKYVPDGDKATLNTIKFYCPNPMWTKTTLKSSFENTQAQAIFVEDDNLKSYESQYITDSIEAHAKAGGYDYIYSYDEQLQNLDTLSNKNVLGSNFIITIYGPATNPELEIFDATRSNSVTISFPTSDITGDFVIPEGGALIVNSVNKTALLYKIDGSCYNVFGYRNPNNYLWNRVPYGKCYILANSAFEFTIELLEERSEPKWPTD